MNVLEFEKSEEVFSYFDVQNLSIDHPLTAHEVEEYKDLIFSQNSLQQVYFKDSCDIESIQLIKNLLKISDYIDDSQIDKVVLIKLSDEELNDLISDTYENPETWSIPYEEDNDSYNLTDLPRLRTLKSFVNKINIDNLSPLEIVMKVYDIVKLFDYENSEDVQLPEIVKVKKANSYGFNRLFSYILNSLGFDTFIGKVKSSDGPSYSITLVDIKDSEYGADGIYVFDPSMDTLPKDKYEKKEVRRVNYNYFALSLNNMTKLSYDDRLDGVLSILSIDDDDYSNEKMQVCKSSKVLKEKDKLLNVFGISFKEIHNRIKKAKPIDIETIIRINRKLYNSNIDNYDKLLKDNYETRREELFSKDVEDELEELIEKEKNKNL